SCNSVSEKLGLKGRWNKELMTRDLVVSASVGIGAAIMLYYWFKGEVESPVHHQ
nr:6K2 protein [Tuberose mild mottle virus]